MFGTSIMILIMITIISINYIIYVVNIDLKWSILIFLLFEQYFPS